MFEVSWGELCVVTGLGFALIGKKDLPKAAGFVGNRIGRIVGLLQGARARADTFAQQTELKQLHSELRAGLRELDAVKSEMAVAMSSRSSGGFSMNRTILQSQPSNNVKFEAAQTSSSPSMAAAGAAAGAPPSAISNTSLQATAAASSVSVDQIPAGQSFRSLPPKSQTVAAVAEEEWEKQGIGFRSRAERGVGLGYQEEQANDPLTSGSSILNNIIQQNLIFDQYDRVVQEQDNILQSKIDDMQAKRQESNNQGEDNNDSTSRNNDSK